MAASAIPPPFVGELTPDADPTSFSNFHDIRITRLHLDLTADFTAQTLSGEVILTMTVLNPSLTVITLDSSHLDIRDVGYYDGAQTADARRPLNFHLDATHPAFGSALHIDPPPASVLSSDAPLLLSVRYSSTSGSSGIQWLPPAQTAGKVHPFMFTQFQAIHARSGVPLQDTPAVKFPYTADLTVPKPLVALMSAPQLSPTPRSSSSHAHTFHFDQPVPTPSYLLAIAVGALEARRLGPRSQVWSEAETVEAGAYEFADTEQFLTAAEAIVGPYVWGTYDILLLPPSFPYGGMENPGLTFVTPTLIAGDRSLVGVVAHEASHSWMGNFVGCANWQHFWCNEGFCVFLERKILRALKGDAFFALDAIVGRQSLTDSVGLFGHDHPYTVLEVQLKDVDPDDAFSSVPYEKGFAFLYHLEQLVGGERAMNPFLRAHCQRFAYGTVTSSTFRAFFLGYFEGKVDAAVLAAIDWDTWLHKPGMPPDPHFDRVLVDEAEALARRWVNDPAAMQAETVHPDIRRWDSDQGRPHCRGARVHPFVTTPPSLTTSLRCVLHCAVLLPPCGAQQRRLRAPLLPLVLLSSAHTCALSLCRAADGDAAADREGRVQGASRCSHCPGPCADGVGRAVSLH